MPRPRFHRLATDQQDAILGAALQEFAEYGFVGASLNRIIEASGISKGSMYYYFDDKEDLYRHLVQRELERMIAAAGPFPVPQPTGPEAYWSTIEEYCLRLVRTLDVSPRLAQLLRDWLSGSSGLAMEKAMQDAEQIALPWFDQTLAAGQAAGAVRTDVPSELLLAVATAIGRVMDQWVITGPSDPAAHQEAVRLTVDMMRRALEP